MTRFAEMMARPASAPLRPADVAWLAAYGAAFADELRRACHGQPSTSTTRVGEGFETVTTAIDARAAAARWATTCADLAAASLEET